MLSMVEFQDIIKLRNKGYKQEEIARLIGRSLKSVHRYLNSGKIPTYHRDKPTKRNPLEGFEERAESLITTKVGGKIPRCVDIYRTLSKEGYKGSLRTVQRKTEELRKSVRNQEIYFEQNVDYGDLIEGDFTEVVIPFRQGKEKCYLWIMTMKKSKGCFSAHFSNQTFESFAEGTIKGFSYFGGIPKEYRLDNLKPVVSKILKNGRQTTYKFNQLKEHYGFNPSFCRPRKGNDKGTVEAINKHFKNYLTYEIDVENETFRDEEEFDIYLNLKCEEFNKSKEQEIEKERKHLNPLPQDDFPLFFTEICTVNKYGFIRAGAKRYSVPEEYKYRDVEARLSSKKVEIFYKGEMIKEHKRITSTGSTHPAIDFRDHIQAMLKKPGAFTYYKHKEAFFPSDIFRELYHRYPDNKNYLQCLALCKDYNLIEVQTAISILLEEGISPEYKTVANLLMLERENYNHNELKPLAPSLTIYDNLLSIS